MDLLTNLHFAPTLLLLVLLGGVVAAGLLVGMAALRRTDESPKRHQAGSRVVGGPTLRDGVWWRLVTSQDGHRRVEVLSPQGWVPSHRNVAQLFQAIPGRSSGAPPQNP